MDWLYNSSAMWAQPSFHELVLQPRVSRYLLCMYAVLGTRLLAEQEACLWSRFSLSRIFPSILAISHGGLQYVSYVVVSYAGESFAASLLVIETSPQYQD